MLRPLERQHVEHFEAWLRSGYAGRMDYMHRNLEKRIHPAKLLDGAQSVIVVALGLQTAGSRSYDGQDHRPGRESRLGRYATPRQSGAVRPV